MQKTVQNVKNSLKFKANERDGILSVRVGVKKFVVPVKARMLSDSKYLFLSFPASSEMYRIEGKNLIALDKGEDATEAFEALNPGRRSRGRRRGGGSTEMPAELAEALKNLPAGYRLGYSADGTPKLVKTRTRRSKS
jgi:hypothetical protein